MYEKCAFGTYWTFTLSGSDGGRSGGRRRSGGVAANAYLLVTASFTLSRSQLMSRRAGARWLLSLSGLRVFAMLALSASSGSFVGAGVARRDAQQRFLAERGEGVSSSFDHVRARGMRLIDEGAPGKLRGEGLTENYVR